MYMMVLLTSFGRGRDAALLHQPERVWWRRWRHRLFRWRFQHGLKHWLMSRDKIHQWQCVRILNEDEEDYEHEDETSARTVELVWSSFSASLCAASWLSLSSSSLSLSWHRLLLWPECSISLEAARRQSDGNSRSRRSLTFDSRIDEEDCHYYCFDWCCCCC